MHFLRDGGVSSNPHSLRVILKGHDGYGSR